MPRCDDLALVVGLDGSAVCRHVDWLVVNGALALEQRGRRRVVVSVGEMK
jgi:hypothetical protein